MDLRTLRLDRAKDIQSLPEVKERDRFQELLETSSCELPASLKLQLEEEADRQFAMAGAFVCKSDRVLKVACSGGCESFILLPALV